MHTNIIKALFCFSLLSNFLTSSLLNAGHYGGDPNNDLRAFHDDDDRDNDR